MKRPKIEDYKNLKSYLIELEQYCNFLEDKKIKDPRREEWCSLHEKKEDRIDFGNY